MARAKKLATANLTAEKTMKDFRRMGYPSQGRQFMGRENEAITDGEITLPTEGCYNSDLFFCVDTCKCLMFYNGSWYTLE